MSGVVVIDPDDLAELIEGAVSRALAASRASSEPVAEWLDARGVAEMLGVHPRSVAQYVRRGLPCRRLGPKTVRYERAAVVAWIERKGR